MATTAGTSLSRKIGSACGPASGADFGEVQLSLLANRRFMLGVRSHQTTALWRLARGDKTGHSSYLDSCSVAQQQRDEQQVRVPQDRHDRHGILGLLRGARPLQHLLTAHTALRQHADACCRTKRRHMPVRSTSKSTMSKVSRPARMPRSFVRSGQRPQSAVLVCKAGRETWREPRASRGKADRASIPT